MVFTVAHQAAVLFLGGAHAAHDGADLAEHGGVHQISLVVALRVGQEQAIGAAILYVAMDMMKRFSLLKKLFKTYIKKPKVQMQDSFF